MKGLGYIFNIMKCVSNKVIGLVVLVCGFSSTGEVDKYTSLLVSDVDRNKENFGWLFK